MKAFLLIKFIFEHFRRLVLLNILILILTGLLDAVSILCIAPIFDLLVHPNLQNISSITQKIIRFLDDMGFTVSLSRLLVIFLLINVIRSFMYVASDYFLLDIKFALLRKIFLETYEEFFQAKWYFFSSNKQGELYNTFSREITIVADAFSAISGFFAKSIQCILFIVVPFAISWKLSLISLSCAILFALPFTLFGKLNYRLGKISHATANEIYSVIQESFSSAKIILGFGNQNIGYSSLAKSIKTHFRAGHRARIIETGIPNLYQPLGIAVLVITLFAGQMLNISVSEIVAILYSFYRIIPLFGYLVTQKTSLDNFFPSYEKIFSLQAYAKEWRQKSGEKAFNGIQEKIELKKVFFAYPGNQPVLMDINMLIPKGKMVAIVGESGSGKSTLIDIIMGFNEPLKGLITIDDVQLQEFDINSYRKCLGYVPQDNALFNMTVRDNLLWAKENATETEIKEACAIANATEFIEKLSNRYDTYVGDRGVRLSGGQIQRVALARAILRNPDVLILDEATSSLDSKSEHLIQKAIETISKQTTIIVIAHRLSTITNADYIYVMKNGRIVEKGTYLQLIKDKGLFSQMITSQFSGINKQDVATG